jgi:hypothetical protein
LTKLEEVAKKRGDSAQIFLRETYDKIVEILQNKTKDAEKLAGKFYIQLYHVEISALSAPADMFPEKASKDAKN